MSLSLNHLRGWRISRQIGLLVIAALLLLTGANFIVTFVGPPPRPAPVLASDLVDALKGRDLPDRPAVLMVRETAATAFVPRPGEKRRTDYEGPLARLIGCPRERVRFAAAEMPHPGPRGEAMPPAFFGSFSAGIRDESNRWLVVRSAPQPVLTAWHRTTFTITIGVALLLALIALWVSRGIVSPIRRLSEQADQAYLDGKRGEISVNGPPEIAQLAVTIAAMRDRFVDLVDSRTMMLAAIAHDMATPLARLEFHVAKLPANVRSQAEADLAELSALIASILGYARGQQRLESTPVDLVGLTRDLLERWDRADAPVRLMGAPQAAWLHGDRLSLQRLIGNLIGNTQRYAGGGKIDIEETQGAIVLTVRDDGPGFDPALAERLFEPFFRIEASRSRETAGAGLGLATARAIAEAHGGTLMAQSAPGRGARFILTLPRAANIQP
ncbi:MAG: HAMP domain-containing protein [Sphingomonas sp.]|nr:HAMP domain-containing protein [Sphingomonas sp.]